VPRLFDEEHVMPIRRTADPLAQQIGARIRDLRLTQGKSLDTIAAVCGISKGHLSSIERGYVMINVGTLAKIARGLGVDMVKIFRGLRLH
jgi:transcriptional regulator with XRE-family HTH domain